MEYLRTERTRQHYRGRNSPPACHPPDYRRGDKPSPIAKLKELEGVERKIRPVHAFLSTYALLRSPWLEEMHGVSQSL